MYTYRRERASREMRAAWSFCHDEGFKDALEEFLGGITKFSEKMPNEFESAKSNLQVLCNEYLPRSKNKSLTKHEICESKREIFDRIVGIIYSDVYSVIEQLATDYLLDSDLGQISFDAGGLSKLIESMNNGQYLEYVGCRDERRRGCAWDIFTYTASLEELLKSIKKGSETLASRLQKLVDVFSKSENTSLKDEISNVRADTTKSDILDNIKSLLKKFYSDLDDEIIDKLISDDDREWEDLLNTIKYCVFKSNNPYIGKWTDLILYVCKNFSIATHLKIKLFGQDFHKKVLPKINEISNVEQVKSTLIYLLSCEEYFKGYKDFDTKYNEIRDFIKSSSDIDAITAKVCEYIEYIKDLSSKAYASQNKFISEIFRNRNSEKHKAIPNAKIEEIRKQIENSDLTPCDKEMIRNICNLDETFNRVIRDETDEQLIADAYKMLGTYTGEIVKGSSITNFEEQLRELLRLRDKIRDGAKKEGLKIMNEEQIEKFKGLDLLAANKAGCIYLPDNIATSLDALGYCTINDLLELGEKLRNNDHIDGAFVGGPSIDVPNMAWHRKLIFEYKSEIIKLCMLINKCILNREPLEKIDDLNLLTAPIYDRYESLSTYTERMAKFFSETELGDISTNILTKKYKGTTAMNVVETIADLRDSSSMQKHAEFILSLSAAHHEPDVLASDREAYAKRFLTDTPFASSTDLSLLTTHYSEVDSPLKSHISVLKSFGINMVEEFIHLDNRTLLEQIYKDKKVATISQYRDLSKLEDAINFLKQFQALLGCKYHLKPFPKDDNELFKKRCVDITYDELNKILDGYPDFFSLDSTWWGIEGIADFKRCNGDGKKRMIHYRMQHRSSVEGYDITNKSVVDGLLFLRYREYKDLGLILKSIIDADGINYDSSLDNCKLFEQYPGTELYSSMRESAISEGEPQIFTKIDSALSVHAKEEKPTEKSHQPKMQPDEGKTEKHKVVRKLTPSNPAKFQRNMKRLGLAICLALAFLGGGYAYHKYTSQEQTNSYSYEYFISYSNNNIPEDIRQYLTEFNGIEDVDPQTLDGQAIYQEAFRIADVIARWDKNGRDETEIQGINDALSALSEMIGNYLRTSASPEDNSYANFCSNFDAKIPDDLKADLTEFNGIGEVDATTPDGQEIYKEANDLVDKIVKWDAQGRDDAESQEINIALSEMAAMISAARGSRR